MSTEYYIFHKCETKILAFTVALLMAFVLTVQVYYAYRHSQYEAEKAAIKSEMAQIAPEPEHKVATLPKKEAK